jgi:hypothetical protein
VSGGENVTILPDARERVAVGPVFGHMDMTAVIGGVAARSWCLDSGDVVMVEVNYSFRDYGMLRLLSLSIAGA